MNVHRGQIWENNTTQELSFVCGVMDEWAWYTNLQANRYTETPWSKSKVEHFVKKHTFTKHAVAPKGYWKKRATGDIIQIIGIKDDGWKEVYIYYDLNKIELRDFYHFFEPCSHIEVLRSIAKERSITKNEAKLRKRRNS